MRNDIPDALRIKSLAQVKFAEKALALWETLSSAYDAPPSHVREAFVKVQHFFIEKELQAYRNLFMLTTVFGDIENQEAAQLAIKRFLSVDMSIMHMWSHNGDIPGSWLGEDEVKIRDCFKQVAKELTGKRGYVKKEKDNRKQVVKEVKQILKKKN